LENVHTSLVMGITVEARGSKEAGMGCSYRQMWLPLGS
jgi:hypothetical protein